MAEAPKLKDYFTETVVRGIGERLAKHQTNFSVDKFVDRVLAPAGQARFSELEFTERSRRIADAIDEVAGLEPVALFDLLTRSLPPEIDGTEDTLNDGFSLWPYGELIARHGAEFQAEGLAASLELTKRFTAEFAIRPILAASLEALTTVVAWASDPNEHVRRLASEGTRPRLPWAQRLALPVDDILAMLTQLRADPSPYVRKSVANHLNDLAKEHPDRIIELLASWHAEGLDHTRWIVRHALRNHLKDGTPEALAIFGYKPPRVEIVDLKVTPIAVAIGESVTVEFLLRSKSPNKQLLMIDLVMGYVKANGSTSPKVFKFRELTLDGKSDEPASKRFDLVVRSTRKLYPGTHTLSVRVNGADLATTNFELR